MKKIYTSKFSSFIAGVVDTADKHRFANITANFRKILNGPNGTLRGPGDTDLWNKPEAQNLVSDSLQPPPPTPEFELIFEGAIGQPREDDIS